MVFRHPLAVAKSLAARNGFSLRHGLALWETYNAQALWNLRDLPTSVYSYDNALDDPARFVDELGETLERRGVVLGGSTSEATEVLQPSLRRNTQGNEELAALNKRQHELWDLLRALADGAPWPTGKRLARRSLATRLTLFAKRQRSLLAR
jgi:hypothetical protein